MGEVADGLEIVRLVERHRPRILILAIGMPGLNSFEVTLRVRRRSPQTAVILLPTSAEEQYVARRPQKRRLRVRGDAGQGPRADSRRPQGRRDTGT